MPTPEDIEFAAKESGLSAETVALLVAEDGEELTAVARKVAALLGVKRKCQCNG